MPCLNLSAVCWQVETLRTREPTVDLVLTSVPWLCCCFLTMLNGAGRAATPLKCWEDRMTIIYPKRLRTVPGPYKHSVNVSYFLEHIICSE